ncbi:rubrerythrin-like domain-containing protein [Halorarius halobius]|nr:rubrerythrin-like domain-containing protein [Halorarius halobius]
MHVDPYDPGDPMYECFDCGHRVDGGYQGRCPECSGGVRNIAVSRE